MSLLAPSATVLPGVGGQCGIQHNNDTCFTTQGKALCCSINGCLLSNGCQSGCVDPSVSSSVTLATSTTSANSSTTFLSSSTSKVPASTTTTTSSTSSTSPTPTHSSGLTGKARTGVIVGASVGGVIILVAILLFIYLCVRRKSKRASKRPVKTGSNGDSNKAPVKQRNTVGYYQGPNWTNESRLEHVG